MHLFVNINSTGYKPIDNSEVQNVHEYASVSFRLETREHARYAVVIGDYELSLTLITNKDHSLCYESNTVTCFRNFVGLCPILVTSNNSNTVREGLAVNVYGSKATYDRAISFLRFIVKHKDFSSACFSVSRAGSDGVHNKNNISAKIEAGNSVLSHLKNEWIRFKRDPIAKTSFKNQIQPYSKGQEIDADSIGYIMSNPDSLQQTYAEDREIQIKGTHYTFSSISSRTTVKDANVPENQHILFFLADFHKYLTQLERDLVKSKGSLDKLSVNGVDYLSIDKILQDSGVFLNFHMDKIRAGIKQSFSTIQQFERDLGVKLNRTRSVSHALTQKALVKRHYLVAYKLISQYMKTGEPNWEGESELYGLRNMPKLYEFVVLLNLIGSLKERGFEIGDANYVAGYGGASLPRPLNEPNNKYVMVRGEERIELYYDLHVRQMKMLSINDSIGLPVDIKHSSIKTWQPDYCIIHRQPNQSPRVHILDAKYSNETTTYDVRLPNCTFKYTTCLKILGFENGAPTLKSPNSMILLHSEKDTDLRLINDAVMESVPDFLPLNSLLPAIGVTGVTEMSSRSTVQLLDRLAIKRVYKASETSCS